MNVQKYICICTKIFLRGTFVIYRQWILHQYFSICSLVIIVLLFLWNTLHRMVTKKEHLNLGYCKILIHMHVSWTTTQIILFGVWVNSSSCCDMGYCVFHSDHHLFWIKCTNMYYWHITPNCQLFVWAERRCGSHKNQMPLLIPPK